MATWTSVLCYHLYLLKLISWFLPLIKNTVGCHIFPMKTFPVFSTLLMDWVGGERRYHNGRRLSDPRCHRINFSCSEAISTISIRMVIMIGFQEGCADTHFPFGAWMKVTFSAVSAFWLVADKSRRAPQRRDCRADQSTSLIRPTCLAYMQFHGSQKTP